MKGSLIVLQYTDSLAFFFIVLAAPLPDIKIQPHSTCSLFQMCKCLVRTENRLRNFARLPPLIHVTPRINGWKIYHSRNCEKDGRWFCSAYASSKGLVRPSDKANKIRKSDIGTGRKSLRTEIPLKLHRIRYLDRLNRPRIFGGKILNDMDIIVRGILC